MPSYSHLSCSYGFKRSDTEHFSDRPENTFPDTRRRIALPAGHLLLDHMSGALEKIVEQGVLATDVGDESLRALR